jgi:hypothetical protein
MEMTEREKEIIFWALDCYYTQIISQIVSQEKHHGKAKDNLRKLKKDISQLLKRFDE